MRALRPIPALLWFAWVCVPVANAQFVPGNYGFQGYGYGVAAPPVNVPITGPITPVIGYPAWGYSNPYPYTNNFVYSNNFGGGFVPNNGFVLQEYGGIGPYGGPAYGRVVAGSNVVGYSNNNYSSFNGQFGGLGGPFLSNRVGGVSSNATGFNVIPGGGVSAFGATSSFGYGSPFSPGIPPAIYGSTRTSGMTTLLPAGGN